MTQRKNQNTTQNSSASRLRILHVGNHTIPCMGGIENVIWDSARTQAKMGHDVTVMVFNTCTRSEGVGVLPELEEMEGVRIVRVSEYKAGFYRVPPISLYLDEIKRHDILHIHGFGGWLDLACVTKKIHRKPIVVNTHGLYFHTQKRAWFKRIYSRAFLPLVKRAVDYFCADSAQDYSNLLPLRHEKGRVIPNGVNIAPFLRVLMAKKEMNHFLFVGRLSQNKRIDLLLDAFAVVQQKNPSAKLSIIGEDWERLLPSLEKHAAELKLKHVSFDGRISSEKMLQRYAAAGVCVSASAYEGFGVGIIEGMAAGCIPCVNAIPTFTEFVGEDRGVCVDFTDSVAAGRAMMALAQQSKKETNAMRLRARDYSNGFALDTIAREHVVLYREVLQRPKYATKKTQALQPEESS